MSGSITFQNGPFKGWRVMLHSSWTDEGLAHATVQIETPGHPRGLSGILAFNPDIVGWEQAWAAEMHGGPVAMASLLEWIIEATAVELDRNPDIDPVARTHWQTIVDAADHSRAEFAALYPDGRVPAFEVVAELVYDRRTGALAAAA